MFCEDRHGKEKEGERGVGRLKMLFTKEFDARRWYLLFLSPWVKIEHRHRKQRISYSTKYHNMMVLVYYSMYSAVLLVP